MAMSHPSSHRSFPAGACLESITPQLTSAMLPPMRFMARNLLGDGHDRENFTFSMHGVDGCFSDDGRNRQSLRGGKRSKHP